MLIRTSNQKNAFGKSKYFSQGCQLKINIVHQSKKIDLKKSIKSLKLSASSLKYVYFCMAKESGPLGSSRLV